MTSPTTPLVDHIVILIPHSFLSSPPSWFADLFHFYPGGRHSDGLTENTLVLLADGSYLEFIAFVPGVDPAKRAAHQWGRKKEGTVVDWAVTLPPPPPSPDNSDGEARFLEQEKAFREIQKRVRDANAGIVYGDLRRGGRTRPDGEVLKWGVAFPRHDEQAGGGPVEPGTVPFWCLDVTARHLRVPYTDPGVTKHSIGAVGVAKVEVLPNSQKIAESARVVYDTILDAADTNGSWNVGSPAGATVHSGGTVRLGASKGSAGVNITFFTDDPSLVGRSVGGKVDDDNTLAFHLVAAFDRRG
ncbi:glyoxalase-like domain-containing protein [Daldinia caldariorum]|uniref:glyoxalase-like domain-containing protein n=1 Tax=Daldinia caldariorum TaxID=326644 RepID=UPI002008E42A|nr:glyoxalase-like domain-containing protein [Daldinia caldariorum]KAI1468170.1 glyoxalase-like domain-containing protein [Daldinia caldariorum]